MAHSPFRVAGIDHIVLRVNDLPAMLAFYQRVLGCVVERQVTEIGLCQLRAGRALIDLITDDGTLGRIGGRGPGQEARNLDHFALVIEPFDEGEIRAHLAAHDVDIIDAGTRYGATGESPSVYITDPELNTVELKGSSAWFS